MNTTITTVLVILGIAVLIYLYIPRSRLIERGYFKDLPGKFNVLLNSKPEITKVVVAIHGQEDFIQFSRHGKKVEMDYPAITPRQIELSNKYREICSNSDIEVRETKGSDGALFLDANVPSDAEELARITKMVLVGLFGANDGTKLKFTLMP